MTLERLNQYRYLVSETKLLEKRLAALHSTRLVDAVQASSTGPDYTLREVSVFSDTARDQLERRYRRRLHRVQVERNTLESYIEQIGDSYLRQIITLRFVDGFSWQRVADSMGGSEDSVRMACQRFLQGK